jgi:hypothetical protein
MSHTPALVYAASIFFALALVAVLVMRRQRTAGSRVSVFLLFVVVGAIVTTAVNSRWNLLMGEAAAAWIGALLVLGVLAGIERFRASRA